MATHLSSITGIGSSAKKLAALLQKKAPSGEKLAFINDREAALLKRHGGSGKEVEDTGIKSYDDTEGFDLQPTNIATGAANADYTSAPVVGGPIPDREVQPTNIGGQALSPFDSVRSLPIFGESQQTASAAEVRPPPVPTAGAPATQYQAASPVGIDQNTPQENFRKSEILAENAAAQPQQAPTKPTQGLTDYLSQPKNLLGLGMGGLQALYGANQARRAQAQGQEAANQLKQMAAPYQQQAAQLQAQTASGTLTPANQQALQAAQAQMAQQLQARGGVGSAQMQTQIANLTNQLLASQQQYALQLSGIGDSIAQGAIKAGVQADQYAQQLTNAYMGNVARTVTGVLTGQPQTPTGQ